MEAHDCLECSPAHCQRVADAARCEFGICPRDAELELVLGEALLPVRVCGLHVSAVVGWGQPEPLEPRVRFLPAQHHPGAAA